MYQTIRQAAVAGLFYPSDPAQLHSDVETYVDCKNASQTRPKVIIAPHAGYIYSGAVAGRAYAHLKPWANSIKNVVLLGPAHRVFVEGIALPDADFFETPLGPVAVNASLIDKIKNLPHVHERPQAHLQEHSIEVHIPFLQHVLGEVSIVPLVVGRCDFKTVSTVIESLWGDTDTLIVISTDLSHFLTYEEAVSVDEATCKLVENFQYEMLSGEQACGAYPLSGMLALAKHKKMEIKRIQYCNSGDTAGDKNRVVGYGAWVLYE